ncbi:MAG: signal peptidase I [Clostridiaceae bacterium]|nr:signal peptidase I [Clostridiaceae bacterium]
MKSRYLPVYSSKKRALLMLGAVLFIYLLDNLPVSSIIDYKIYSNFIKPILWLGLAGSVWALPRVRPKAPLKLRGNIYWWSFNFAAIFIAASVIAGFFEAFGKSPYDHSVTGIIINIFAVGAMLVGRESARNCIVNNLTGEESFLVFIPVSLLMTLISFKVDRFVDLKGLEGVIQFAAQFIAPEFLQNLMATYLVFLGGFFPALVYMGIIQAFHWFSPVLPNLKWITAALVGILCPAFSLPAIQGIYLKDTKAMKNSDKEKESLGGWIVTSLISIGIIWFSVGVFPIYPSVIATGSMKPVIKPGDMILVEKILDMEDIDKLKVGDIIQFKKDSYMVSHRIIEIVEEEEIKLYRTKGDNNPGPDTDLVKPEDLKGRVRFAVPKVGWPTLIIKREDDIPLEDIEF